MTRSEQLLVETAVDYLSKVNGAPISDHDYAVAFLAGLLIGHSPDKSSPDMVRINIDQAVILLEGR